MTALVIVLIVVVLAALYVAYRFNSLIRLRTRTQEAWSDIDVELKRRYDLIPNLVNTVQGYATHERGVFEAVTAARTNRSEEHTSELQSPCNLVCRLLLE